MLTNSRLHKDFALCTSIIMVWTGLCIHLKLGNQCADGVVEPNGEGYNY